jgi:signal recognition particle GTPase
MRITKRQLRRIIKEQLLLERGEANVTQIKKYEPEIREWVETLIDSMADHVSDKIKEIDEKSRKRIIDGVTKATVQELIGQFGYVTSSQQKRFEEDDFKKKMERERRSSGKPRWS